MSDQRNHLQDNDARFAEFARSITAEEWAQPSLCTEWTNHDVLAHLVIGYTTSAASIAVSVLRHRGSFNRTNAELARTLSAQRNPAQLLDDFTVLSQKPGGIGRIFPKRLLLGDHVIHELDIVYTLGKESSIPTATFTAVLDTQVRLPNPFVPAAARARGLNLYANDADWTHRYDGPTVAGAGAHLVSVLAGRPWALQHLAGDGVTELRSRL